MPILNVRVQAEVEDSDEDAPQVGPKAGLQQIGPRVPIILTPPQDHLDALSQRGQVLPQPVQGMALIDTGASATCIDRQAAERAGLNIVESGPMASATDVEIVPIYAARLDVLGFPGWDALRAYGANLATHDLIALVGRDVLMDSVLIYNGPDGSFSIAR